MEINSATSRIRAALVNTGKYGFEEAEQKLASIRLRVHITESAGSTRAGQAAALTAVLTGARCFSEVLVTGAFDCSMTTPLPVAGSTIGDLAVALGGTLHSSHNPTRTVFIGAGDPADSGSVRAIWNGWGVGIAPGHKAVPIGRGDCALAGIAAGALAVGHCFLAEQGHSTAGRTMQGFSLWNPDIADRWFEEPGPLENEVFLPTALWLVGLGNLGQAFLWSLSWLPYANASDLLLFLQDDDLVGEENWGTSILVQRGRYDVLKTRICEEWAEGKGFKIRRIDRRLDGSLKRGPLEPGIALGGLDRMPARRLLGLPGFDYVIDAGLGADAHDFHRLRVNTFNATRTPADHFAGVEDKTDQRVSSLKKLPAYAEHERLSSDGGCGTAQLAGQSVAVPFVSAVAGAITITQAIRLASGQAPYFSVCGSLDDVRGIRAHLGNAEPVIGTGSVLAAQTEGPRQSADCDRP